MRRMLMGFLVTMAGVCFLAESEAANFASNADIESLMKKLNKGANKTLKNGLKDKEPKWDALATAAKEYVKIGEDLAKTTPDADKPKTWKKHTENFVSDLKALETAVGKKSEADAKKAFASVTKRCDECHTDYRQ